jgi:hypothetical protein
MALARFQRGRYYRESDFTTMAQALTSNCPAAQYFSPTLNLGTVRLKTLSWTPVVPRGLKSPLPPGGRAGIDGDGYGADGRIALAFIDTGALTYLKDVKGQPINADGAGLLDDSGRFTNPGWSAVNRNVQAAFRLHAIFRPNVDPVNTPILDPLALDDVTVAYEPLGGPRIVTWGLE